MRSEYKAGSLTLSYALVVALGIGSATGWGLWFLSDRRADQVEIELRGQIAKLAQSQMELLHERAQAQTVKADLATLQSQAASLREKVNSLSQRRDKANAELAIALGELNRLDGASREGTHVSATGSTTPSTDAPRRVVVTAAQKALTNLGYGPLAADGVIGPGTRRAIEEFQYKNGLSVTRELDVETLKRLANPNKVASSE
ncbi:peptidoglycan-binding protein [Microvirga sp. GCM10011540]|uniref:peptidoglycan-binding domain-containing protein n=1 Tax=Microvirga sp. GCM10011540 TaxID=3317338 RepID=UPI00360B4208